MPLSKSPGLCCPICSEAIAILEKANATRDAELQNWKTVSLSTDADDANAEKFLASGFGKSYK